MRGSKFLVVGLFAIKLLTGTGPHGLFGPGATPGVSTVCEGRDFLDSVVGVFGQRR